MSRVLKNTRNLSLIFKEPKPYNEAPYYDEKVVDVNEFHAKYTSFLEDDRENKKKQVIALVNVSL